MHRSRYVASKIAWSMLTILFVVVLNFFIFRVLPGDPARAGFEDPRLSQEAVEAIRGKFGLDKPVINCLQELNPLKTGNCLVNPLDTQFFIYIVNLLHGEMGISYQTNQPVSEMLRKLLVNTLILLGFAQLLAIILGLALGTIAALKAGTTLDISALLFSLAVWSMPTFWFGIILLFIGSDYWGLPIGGRITPGLAPSNTWEHLADVGRHLILPTLTFTFIFLGEYMLIMRSVLLDIFSEDYILMAKAKGLSVFQIVKDHALKNAMLPLVTVIALNLGFTVGGAIQIETVFSWPGLGRAIFEAVNRRDYPMLQGSFLLIAVAVIIANLAAELLYSVMDPRVQEA